MAHADLTSALLAPTYTDRLPPVGRAFTVRQPSFREAIFSSDGGAPKMSDLKAPTYKNRSPVGRAFTVRRPSFREATFSIDGGAPKMSDLKAPTYKPIPRRSGLYGPTAILSRSDIFKRRWCIDDVGPEGTDLQIPIPRRSGLYGPTANPSRSDIFMRRWCTKDVGPEGTDLQTDPP
jgi:hypothetical protein